MNKQYLVTLDENIVRDDPQGMMQRLAIPGVIILDFLSEFFIVVVRIEDDTTRAHVRNIHGVVAVEEDGRAEALSE